VRHGRPLSTSPPRPPDFPTPRQPHAHRYDSRTMSKGTLALVAAISSATGAACTALFYSSRRTVQNANLPPPPVTASGSAATLKEPSPVNPAGLFQYGILISLFSFSRFFSLLILCSSGPKDVMADVFFFSQDSPGQ
jgi:hypothetical protein